MLIQFGQYLKSVREMNNLSIEDISNITKIDKKFIIEMENGNFEFQTPVFIKAFIKSYAKAVNLDPDDVLKKYELALNNKDTDVFIKTEMPASTDTTTQEKPKITFGEDTPTTNYNDVTNQINHDGYSKIGYQKTPYIYIGAAVVLIVVIVLLIYYFRTDTNPFENKDIVVNNQPKYEQEVVAPNNNTNTTQNIDQAKSDSLVLKITYTKDCWTRIVPDDKKSATIDFVGKPGDTKIVKAKEGFMVWLGNSSATSMSLNDKIIDYDNKRIASIRLNIDSLGNAFEMIPPKKTEQATEKQTNDATR